MSDEATLFLLASQLERAAPRIDRASSACTGAGATVHAGTAGPYGFQTPITARAALWHRKR